MPFRRAPTAYAATLPQFLIFRCTTIIGVCVEYVAGVAWVAELFSNPKQRESALGYTQSAFGSGRTDGNGSLLCCCHLRRTISRHPYGPRGLALRSAVRADPSDSTHPYAAVLAESPVWQRKKSQGTLKRPSVAEMFRPALRKTTLVTTCWWRAVMLLLQESYLQTPRMVPGLPEVRNSSPRLVEQTVSSVQVVSGTRHDCGPFAVCLSSGSDRDAEDSFCAFSWFPA